MLDYYVCMQWSHAKKWVQLDKDSPAIPLPVIHLVAGPYDLTTALTVKREHDEVHRQGSSVDRDLHHTFFGKENHSTSTDTGGYAVYSAQDLCTKALNRKITIDYYRRLPEYKVSPTKWLCIISEVPSAFPKTVNEWLDIAKLHYNAGLYDNALSDLTKALYLNPQDASVHGLMGIVYTALKQYHTALQSHNQSLELEPHFGGGYFWRGETYYELRLYARAFGDYCQALQLLPTMGGADEVQQKITFCYSQILSLRLSRF